MTWLKGRQSASELRWTLDVFDCRVGQIDRRLVLIPLRLAAAHSLILPSTVASPPPRAIVMGGLRISLVIVQSLGVGEAVKDLLLCISCHRFASQIRKTHEEAGDS